MENKDLTPAGASDVNETTPLVHEEKKDEVTAPNESSLAMLASELSGLSLQIGEKAASVPPVDAESTDSQETVIKVPSSEGEQSGSSTDVEQSEATVPDEPTDNQTEEPQEDESPQSSGSETEIRSGNRRLFDKTMWLLLWEIILLGFPISEAYYSFKFVRGCEDGDKLPLLLILMAFVTFMTLLGRILINIAKKLSFYDESNAFPRMSIIVGDFLSIVLFVAEMAYFFTIDSELCNETFYGYVFFVNNMILGVLALLFTFNYKKCLRLFNILRE